MDILDASSLLAFIKKEKGWQVVKNLFYRNKPQGVSIFIHQINFIETLYCCFHIFGKKKTKSIIQDLHTPFLGIVNYMDTDIAFFSAYLKDNYALSLGDAIGLAYTKMMNGTFWTGDRILNTIAEKEKISLQLIR